MGVTRVTQDATLEIGLEEPSVDLGVKTVVKRAGILGVGVGAITEHVKALNAFIKSRGAQ